MFSRQPLLLAAAGLSLAALSDTAYASETPTAHHPNIESITLFAQNPDIVTPVGIAVAPDGRVFVQENHTHKRTKAYTGPAKDRILVFEDTDGDGVSDKRSIFYDGEVFSTDLLFGPDGHLYVSNRWFVGRFRDAATLEKANGEPEILIKCETEGDYPHNGVGGLAIDPANPEWMVFGFGENLGADYTFVGTDGGEISGGGEGGSTYICKTDGSQLKRLSTGHWNAFGMAYDLEGNLFSTDNDPSSTPPNRLLHIIPGADFGYEYRYGRSGRHPLVSWYGDTPGTLGMIGALGEAACGLVPYGAGKLLSASWTDNRIDLHPITKSGASFEAGREPFVSGTDDFRPVHFSYSDDGKSLYFTDWVKISYPVHGHGKVWKITFKEPIDLAPRPRQSKPVLTPDLALNKLGVADPYSRTAAMDTLVQNPELLKSYDWKSNANPIFRAHYAVALKRLDPKAESKIIPDLLADESDHVRYVGIKWIADEKLTEYQDELQNLFERSDLGRRDLLSAVAAMAAISGNSKREFSPSATLLSLAQDTDKAPRLRALALQNVPLDYQGLTVAVLSELAQSKAFGIKQEAIRLLALHTNPESSKALAEAASNKSLAPKLRADAIAGLAPFATENETLLRELESLPNKIVSAEARRSLASAGLIARDLSAKPPMNDVAAWEVMLDATPGEADPSVGRRLFFHKRIATCANCHSMDGRGIEVGPDLTSIGQQSGGGRAWLLEHILNPSAEVAPYFRPQILTTRDDKTHMGLILGQEGRAQGYMGVDGKKFSLLKADVVNREELSISLMPPGLLNALSGSEVRDLLAYLLKNE